MRQDISSDVRQMLGRIPRWMRSDLSSAEPKLREWTEDALAAMIGAVIGDANDAAKLSPPSAASDEKSALALTGG